MYKTMQYKALRDFFREGQKEQYSSEEIIEALCDGGPLGKSTLYRQLGRMTEEGELRRFHQGKRVFYQYAHQHSGCDGHFHLKCLCCGKLIHLACDHVAGIAEHISSAHGFTLDLRESVLYGRCEACRGKDATC
ncbi:MAG: transcriptional repressor [Clostridia bacterium]|nr:transcriptional repressor [Clostridia bacterium]